MSNESPAASATLLAGDESALLLMQRYSKACAAFSHEPSRINAIEMDTRRAALLNHAAQREHAISAAIDRLVNAATWAGATFSSTGEWQEAHQARKDREVELRNLIGLS